MAPIAFAGETVATPSLFARLSAAWSLFASPASAAATASSVSWKLLSFSSVYEATAVLIDSGGFSFASLRLKLRSIAMTRSPLARQEATVSSR